MEIYCKRFRKIDKARKFLNNVISFIFNMRMLRHFILSIIANAGAIFGVAYLLPGEFIVKGGVLGFVLVGITLGLLNTVIKPVLKLISLPFIVLTLGLFLMVINMAIIWIIQWLYDGPLGSLGVGIELIGGWTTLFFAALILSILNSLTHWLIK